MTTGDVGAARGGVGRKAEIKATPGIQERQEQPALPVPKEIKATPAIQELLARKVLQGL